MQRNPRLSAVILDLDGTLVDSNDAQAMAWLEALREAGFRRASFERLRPLMGLGNERVLTHSSGMSLESREGRQIMENRARIFSRRYLPGVKPFLGTRALLERFHRQGLKLVVATSAGLDEALGLIWAAGIPDLLDDAVTGSDLAHAGGGRSLLEAALSQCGCEPGGALFLGVTPYDVEAARHAGMKFVAVRCGGWAEAALDGATAIYRDARDLLNNYSTSPFAAAAPATFATPGAAPVRASGQR
jgi:phosphoglycolate phosphatase-like HAD superfamily hydrolase